MERQLNLFLAVFWLTGGVGLLIWDGLNPGNTFKIPYTTIPLGWFAIMMVGLNLLRWWFARLKVGNRETMERPSGRHRHPEEEERHPEFDFSEGKDGQEKTDDKKSP
jgi:hypothetical protein